MDLYRAIRELYTEKERLDRVIASLEELVISGQPLPGEPEPKRRGRKGMGAEERKQVAERMRRYWAAKRAAPAAKVRATSKAS